jgi:hypothetical protein
MIAIFEQVNSLITVSINRIAPSEFGHGG